jgi:hypothetical protein
MDHMITVSKQQGPKYKTTNVTILQVPSGYQKLMYGMVQTVNGVVIQESTPRAPMDHMITVSLINEDDWSHYIPSRNVTILQRPGWEIRIVIDQSNHIAAQITGMEFHLGIQKYLPPMALSISQICLSVSQLPVWSSLQRSPETFTAFEILNSPSAISAFCSRIQSTSAISAFCSRIQSTSTIHWNRSTFCLAYNTRPFLFGHQVARGALM